MKLQTLQYFYRSELSDNEIYREKQQPVYEAPDQVADVGGPPTAIELSECPAYAPTESGGGRRK